MIETARLILRRPEAADWPAYRAYRLSSRSTAPMPEGEAWTLLAPHNAAAAKLRQLAPALQAALAVAGHPVRTLRIKVAQARR